MMHDGEAGTQAIDRALGLLASFDDGRDLLTVAEAAERLGVHRTTASRLLSALERAGLLTTDDARRGYVLGLGLLPLAGRALARYPVRSAATEIIRELRDQTGETTWIGVPFGASVIFLDQASSPHVHVNVDWVGRSQPLAAGVSGTLLLALVPALLADLPSSTDGPSARELQRVRRQGHLARGVDVASGHAAVAVPVRDHRGEVAAALSVSGPPHRVDARRLADELTPAALEAAGRISERMGGIG